MYTSDFTKRFFYRPPTIKRGTYTHQTLHGANSITYRKISHVDRQVGRWSICFQSIFSYKLCLLYRPPMKQEKRKITSRKEEHEAVETVFNAKPPTEKENRKRKMTPPIRRKTKERVGATRETLGVLV